VNNTYDVLVVGAGMAGLTAAAYLAKAGKQVLICERSSKPGGLVTDFQHEGFHFDAGLRAVENSGVIRPMLRDLGIEVEFVNNPVSIRIGDEMIRLDEDGLNDYGAMLSSFFPDHAKDIQCILKIIRQVMDIMDVLYGIDNPLFLDIKSDPKYLMHTLLPWLLRYQVNIRKMKRYKEPIEQFLAALTGSQALIDMIAQHFFRNTPSFFALSYFGLYMDYMYPKGGTGVLSSSMAKYVKANGGEMRCETAVIGIDPLQRTAFLTDGNVVQYQKMIWAADSKALYRAAGSAKGSDDRYQTMAKHVADGHGGDSVLSVFFEFDLEPGLFQKAFGAHCFFTPCTAGLNSLGLDNWSTLMNEPDESARQKELEDWLFRYLSLTTFEISCPVIRDETLAPANQTGLIVSTLFSMDFVRNVKQFGWYTRFKELCVKQILLQLENALPGIGNHLLKSMCSTPLTIERMTGNADGAITGWSFSNHIPAESRFQKIAKSVSSPIPHVYQAGQWTFSPSGLPVSVITGKLAADAAIKDLSRDKHDR